MTTETKITKTPTRCPSCNGYGRRIFFRCASCNGTGILYEIVEERYTTEPTPIVLPQSAPQITPYPVKEYVYPQKFVPYWESYKFTTSCRLAWGAHPYTTSWTLLSNQGDEPTAGVAS